jgi:peptidoglycan-associated lipoprotein
MVKTYKNMVLSLCAIALLAGCASKDVGFESQGDGAQSSSSTDSKLDNIVGSETTVDGTMGETSYNTTTETVYDDSVNRVESDLNGQTVTMNSIHFAFDKYNITDDMRTIATENANKINNISESYSSLKVKLEGNCDEWGTDEYNYALGLKRAKSVKDALVADGINADRIMMVSYGESNPVCNEKNVKCWKKNRRVDYRLLP